MADTIAAEIVYAVDTGEKLINQTMPAGDMNRIVTGKYESQRVQIRNGRADPDQFDIDQNGFILTDHPTQMTDFLDAEELKSVYYPEVQQLVMAKTGAARVEIFDYTLRSGDEATRKEKLMREPVRAAHNDYTEVSAPRRVREILPDEAKALLSRRFAIVQVWRAIRNPIEADPLTMCDARSFEMGDFLTAERRYPERVGETYRMTYNPAHEWYYFPRMHRDEALVFKVYDSETRHPGRFTPHTSFVDPATPPDAGPRESIEVRAFAFFDD
ncbi:MAG: CmcJ/NvfI family oxidoreductase [Alphaproteobacteria bacterium]|nr:CmcJ/NvfI family oxidoreductase [Alphaproteobacteria bacterium]